MSRILLEANHISKSYGEQVVLNIDRLHLYDGERVTKLQKALIEKGYMTGTANGTYGPTTREAVTKFQTDNKLDADGVAGAGTLALLYGTATPDPAAATGTAEAPATSEPPASVTASPNETPVPEDTTVPPA